MQGSKLTTAESALNYLICRIEVGEDDALLTDLLTRLGAVCGARPDPDSLMCLAKFEQALRLERGRRKLMAAIAVARGIDG